MSSHNALTSSYPAGSLYEDSITKRVWVITRPPVHLSSTVTLTPYAEYDSLEEMDIDAAVFVATKRFVPVHPDALILSKDGAYIRMDEELLQTTFGNLDDYLSDPTAPDVTENIVAFPGKANPQEEVVRPAMDYNPLTRVEEIKDRLTEVIACHRKIVVESEALLATLTAFERDFKAQIGLPVSDI